MSEIVKYVPHGSIPHHCPHCGSDNIRLTESMTYGSCNVCNRNFVIRYFKPKTSTAKRSISAIEVQKMRHELSEKGGY